MVVPISDSVLEFLSLLLFVNLFEALDMKVIFLREIMLKLTTYIMWGLYKLYPYHLSISIRKYRDFFYTLWLKSYIGEMGHHTFIAYPCNIQGGGQKHIKIGNHSSIKRHGVLGCWTRYKQQTFNPSITIGDFCSIGEYCHITAINKVAIGNGLLTGRFIFIGDNSHGGLSLDEARIPPVQRLLKTKGEIVIGNNVWIGDKASILSGVHIGNNVIIAANSVITKMFQTIQW